MKHALLATVLLVTGCASPDNQAALRSYQNACAVGNDNACQAAATQTVVNQDEAQQNANIAVGVVLLPLIILAVIGGARGGHGGYHR